MTEFPGKPKSGNKAAIVAGSAALAESQHCLSILLSAPSGNTDDVFVGDSAAQDTPIPPGANLTLGIDNPSDLFVRSPTGSQTINFLMEI